MIPKMFVSGVDMMRDSIYLIVLLNFLNRPILGNWPTDYKEGYVVTSTCLGKNVAFML